MLKSTTDTIPGCRRREVTCASRMKRGSASGMIAHARVEELHGVAVRQARVGRLVDLAHPAAADAAHDAVRAAQQRTWLYIGHHWLSRF